MSDQSAPRRVLGIDVSKHFIDAHLLPEGQAWHVGTTPKELTQWIAGLPAGIELVVMEASGGLQNLPAAMLGQAGHGVAIVNPGQVRQFAQAMGQRAKTDAIDARMIALFGQRMQPEPRPLPGPEQALLAELLGRRTQLVQTVVAEKNRLETARATPVRRDIEQHVAWLEKRLARIEEDIDGQIKGSPMWRANEKLLVSVPGIGETTARMLQAALPELGSLDRREIAALAGLAPYPRQSGQWKGKPFISGGRGGVRTGLYMPALTALRCNPVFKTFYERLLAQGKPPKVCIVAVMRKMLTILNAIIRDQKPWNACA
jgi:transposase